MVPVGLIDDLTLCVQQIVDHTHENIGLKILSAKFYFKVDKNDKLVLIMTSNIKTDTVDSVTLGDKVEVRFK